MIRPQPLRLAHSMTAFTNRGHIVDGWDAPAVDIPHPPDPFTDLLDSCVGGARLGSDRGSVDKVWGNAFEECSDVFADPCILEFGKRGQIDMLGCVHLTTAARWDALTHAAILSVPDGRWRTLTSRVALRPLREFYPSGVKSLHRSTR